MPQASGTRPADREDARLRLRTAEAYRDVAELVLDDADAAMPGVAAGLAVLAGIAVADALCARRLGAIHRGDDHRGASKLLEQAVPDGKRLSATFLRLVDLKDEAHYGLIFVTAARARHAVRWAGTLVDRARDEVQR